MNFSEILSQFNNKHKFFVVLIFLIYGMVTGLGGKYLDAQSRIKDTEKIDSITTRIEKNCELQKRELLATQSIMQGQINDILKDLITLRTQMAHNYLDTYQAEQIKKSDLSSNASYIIKNDTTSKGSESIPKKKNTKSSNNYKCLQQINKIIDKTESIKK